MRDARRRYNLAIAAGREADAAQASADYDAAFAIRKAEILQQAAAERGRA